MKMFATAVLVYALVGCSNMQPHDYSACAAQPAGMACQVDRYLAAP